MNKKTEKKHNLTHMIECLRRQGPMTQAQLKDQCKIQASTASYLVKYLKSRNLVVDIGQTEQGGRAGKPGQLIALNNDEALFLGIYVEDEEILVYVIGVDGNTFKVDTVKFESEFVEKAIFSIVSDLLATHPNIKGVGLTMKAIVYNDGKIKSALRPTANNKDGRWNLEGLPAALQKKFPNISIIVENDANCAAELYHYENTVTTGNFVVYLLNNNPFGIGLGLMTNGNIFKGATGAAGEFYEKNSKIRDIANEIKNENDFVDKFIPAFLPHILATFYLVDPECVVLSGTYFENLSKEKELELEAFFEQSTARVKISSGEKRLNPAKGAALLAIRNYIFNFVEEVVRE